MMAERGITLTHTTILRWVRHYMPDFEKRWSRYARPVGDSWRVDETYLKIKGQWVYLYRAVDKAGRQTVLFPGDEAAWRPKGDHLGRLRRLASGGRGQGYEVLTQSARALEPTEGAFDDPAPQQHSKSLRLARPFHDRKGPMQNRGYPINQVPGVTPSAQTSFSPGKLEINLVRTCLAPLRSWIPAE